MRSSRRALHAVAAALSFAATLAGAGGGSSGCEGGRTGPIARPNVGGDAERGARVIDPEGLARWIADPPAIHPHTGCRRAASMPSRSATSPLTSTLD